MLSYIHPQQTKAWKQILFTSVELKRFCLILKQQHPWEMGFIQAILLDKQDITGKHGPIKHQCWVICLWVVQVVDRGPTQILDDERREKLSKKGTLQWVSSSFVNSSKKSCQIWVTPELPRDLEQENALPRQEGQRGEITSKLFQTKIDS